MSLVIGRTYNCLFFWWSFCFFSGVFVIFGVGGGNCDVLLGKIDSWISFI